MRRRRIPVCVISLSAPKDQKRRQNPSMDRAKSPENWMRMKKKELSPVCFLVSDVIWQICDGTGSSENSMSQYLYFRRYSSNWNVL